MADGECTAFDTLSTITEIITAAGTVLIALVGQLYARQQKKQREIEAQAAALEAVCNSIQLDSAQLLMMNHTVSVQGNLVYLSSGAMWNSAWNLDHTYAEKNPAAARLIMDELLDLLRAAADAFHLVRKSSASKEIWVGKFDVKTQKVRRLLKSFKPFYNSSFDGIQEMRQQYVQHQIGNATDWYEIVDMLEAFDSSISRKTWPWIMGEPTATEKHVPIEE